MTRRLGGNGGVGGNAIGGEARVVGQRVERSTVEAQGDLDLCFIGNAVDESIAAGRCFGHYGRNGSQILYVFS